MPKLRYLPTSEELRQSTLPPAKRNRPIEKIYSEAARILLGKGLIPATCPIWHCHEAYAEAKRRLVPDPFIR